MPITTKTIDALFLGTFATGGTPSAASGVYSAPGNTAGTEVSKVDLQVTANELQGVNSPSPIDFSLSNNNGSQGIDSGDGFGRQQVIYSQYVTVTFTATNGTTFSARMSIVQKADGDMFMFRDPTAIPQQNYNSLVGSREIASFSIPALGTSRTGITVAETDTFGASFPDPPPPCFTTGTMILTDRGEVAVETLRQGDLVMTMDHGLQPVRWIGTKTLSARQLSSDDKLRPIRIKAGALGNGLPKTDLTVSPQHRMLVRSNIAQRMFGQDEVLVAAKQLVPLDGIDVLRDATAVTYVHFLCNQHEVVFANGAPTESLYTGPQALKSVPAAARAEILAIFPELSDVDYTTLSARTLVKGRQGRQLAVRHKNNAKPLLTAH